MVDVENESELVEKNQNIITEKVYKTKDYVRRANNKYRKKKYTEDPEYREKQIESCKQSHKKNPDKYREYSRLYMREYRAKKKLEKANANINANVNANVNGGDTTVNPDNSESDTITTKLAEIEM